LNWKIAASYLLLSAIHIYEKSLNPLLSFDFTFFNWRMFRGEYYWWEDIVFYFIACFFKFIAIFYITLDGCEPSYVWPDCFCEDFYCLYSRDVFLFLLNFKLLFVGVFFSYLFVVSFDRDTPTFEGLRTLFMKVSELVCVLYLLDDFFFLKSNSPGERYLLI